MNDADTQWRRDVSAQLQETAVILERLKGELDVHDNRIDRLEASPSINRANINVVVGVAVLFIGLATCVFGPLLTFALNYLGQHLH